MVTELLEPKKNAQQIYGHSMQTVHHQYQNVNYSAVIFARITFPAMKQTANEIIRRIKQMKQQINKRRYLLLLFKTTEWIACCLKCLYKCASRMICVMALRLNNICIARSAAFFVVCSFVCCNFGFFAKQDIFTYVRCMHFTFNYLLLFSPIFRCIRVRFTSFSGSGRKWKFAKRKSSLFVCFLLLDLSKLYGCVVFIII